MSATSGSTDAGKSVMQNSVFIGMNIENILYGIELVLYFKTMHVLLAKGGVHKKSNLFYAVFSSIMLFAVTVWVATTAIFGEEMWLLNSDFPGGFDAYVEKNISIWYMDWGTTAVILLQLMTDGLMIYRCRILWNSNLIIILPIFFWLSTLVLAVFVDWTSSTPGGNFFSGVSSQLALAYYAVSVFLNALLTCMICYRIVQHGRRAREHLGREYASFYFRIVTLVVESVLPYTLSGIAFLVSFSASSMSPAFLPVYVLMMSISPQMLILRVAGGTAWNNNTATQSMSTIKFNSGDKPKSQQTNSSGTSANLQTLSKAYIPDGHGKVIISPV